MVETHTRAEKEEEEEDDDLSARVWKYNLYVNVSTTDNYLLLFPFTAGAILSLVVCYFFAVVPFRLMTTCGQQTNVNDKRRTKSGRIRSNDRRKQRRQRMNRMREENFTEEYYS